MILPKIRRVEDLVDMATLVVVVGLGLAMLIGLATASGTITW